MANAIAEVKRPSDERTDTTDTTDTTTPQRHRERRKERTTERKPRRHGGHGARREKKRGKERTREEGRGATTGTARDNGRNKVGEEKGSVGIHDARRASERGPSSSGFRRLSFRVSVSSSLSVSFRFSPCPPCLRGFPFVVRLSPSRPYRREASPPYLFVPLCLCGCPLFVVRCRSRLSRGKPWERSTASPCPWT